MDEVQDSKFLVQHCPSLKEISSPSILVAVSVDLEYLLKIVHDLEVFLYPVWDQRNTWITLHKNKFYRLYFDVILEQCYSTLHLESIECFLTAECNKRLLNVLHYGDTNYRTLSLNRRVRLDTFKNGEINDALKRISECLPGTEEQSCEQLPGYKGIVSLVNVASTKRLMHLICHVCEMMEIKGCLDDEMFQKIRDILKILSNEERENELTLNDAIHYSQILEECLLLTNVKQCTYLFAEVEQSNEFFKFVFDSYYSCVVAAGVEEKEQQATISFQQTIEVVQHQLINENYEEQVLQKLLPAFMYVLPFMDQSQSLRTLISKVNNLRSETKFEELKVVRENFNEIELWLRHVSYALLRNHVQQKSSRSARIKSCTILLDTQHYYWTASRTLTIQSLGSRVKTVSQVSLHSSASF